MDVLSSQANLAGYRAIIESVEEFGKDSTEALNADESAAIETPMLEGTEIDEEVHSPVDESENSSKPSASKGKAAAKKSLAA